MRRNRDHRRTSFSRRELQPSGCRGFRKGSKPAGRGRKRERQRVIRWAPALIYFTLKSPRIGGRKAARYNDARNRKWHVWGNSLESPFFPDSNSVRHVCPRDKWHDTLCLHACSLSHPFLFRSFAYTRTMAHPSFSSLYFRRYFKVALSRHAESPSLETISRRHQARFLPHDLHIRFPTLSSCLGYSKRFLFAFLDSCVYASSCARQSVAVLLQRQSSGTGQLPATNITHAYITVEDFQF